MYLHQSGFAPFSFTVNQSKKQHRRTPLFNSSTDRTHRPALNVFVSSSACLMCLDWTDARMFSLRTEESAEWVEVGGLYWNFKLDVNNSIGK